MKCENCGKREATVRYMENINGEKREMHLCSNCASNLGFMDFSSMFSPIFSSIPSSFFSDEKLQECPTCGYTIEDYSKTGLFGCPDCYKTFEDELDRLFVKIHGKNRHVRLEESKNSNKNKEVNSNKNELEELKEKIQVCIKNEEYEEAAKIRDQIRKIEGK